MDVFNHKKIIVSIEEQRFIDYTKDCIDTNKPIECIMPFEHWKKLEEQLKKDGFIKQK